MYFNGCEIENVTVNGLCYGTLSSPPECDSGYVGKFHRVTVNSLCAAYFNNCISTKNLLFRDVIGAKNLDYIFGGNSDIEVRTENIVMQSDKTKLTSAPKVIKE